jgi:hypothetical protein
MSQSFFLSFWFLDNWSDFTAKTQSFSAPELVRKGRKAGVSAAFLSSRKDTKAQRFLFWSLSFCFMPHFSFENLYPSPGSSGNPFVPGFGTKDWSGEREIAPNTYIIRIGSLRLAKALLIYRYQK